VVLRGVGPGPVLEVLAADRRRLRTRGARRQLPVRPRRGRRRERRPTVRRRPRGLGPPDRRGRRGRAAGVAAVRPAGWRLPAVRADDGAEPRVRARVLPRRTHRHRGLGGVVGGGGRAGVLRAAVHRRTVRRAVRRPRRLDAPSAPGDDAPRTHSHAGRRPPRRHRRARPGRRGGRARVQRRRHRRPGRVPLPGVRAAGWPRIRAPRDSRLRAGVHALPGGPVERRGGRHVPPRLGAVRRRRQSARRARPVRHQTPGLGVAAGRPRRRRRDRRRRQPRVLGEPERPRDARGPRRWPDKQSGPVLPLRPPGARERVRGGRPARVRRPGPRCCELAVRREPSDDRGGRRPARRERGPRRERRDRHERETPGERRRDRRLRGGLRAVRARAAPGRGRPPPGPVRRLAEPPVPGAPQRPRVRRRDGVRARRARGRGGRRVPGPRPLPVQLPRRVGARGRPTGRPGAARGVSRLRRRRDRRRVVRAAVVDLDGHGDGCVRRPAGVLRARERQRARLCRAVGRRC